MMIRKKKDKNKKLVGKSKIELRKNLNKLAHEAWDIGNKLRLKVRCH